jgi:hypothetical protein
MRQDNYRSAAMKGKRLVPPIRIERTTFGLGKPLLYPTELRGHRRESSALMGGVQAKPIGRGLARYCRLFIDDDSGEFVPAVRAFAVDCEFNERRFAGFMEYGSIQLVGS